MKENDKTDNQKKGALWAANSIFISGILISVFLAFYYFLSHMPADLKINLKLFSSSWFGYIVFFITSAILFFLGLRLKDDVKVDLSKYLLAIAFSGYSIEFYLHFNLAKTYKKPVSSQFETVRELRQKGIDAYRDMGGKNAFWSDGLEAENGKIYPLGGISGKTTVLQAQSYGYHPIIKTDEHGFNNKKGFYNKDDVDIIVLGECTIEYNGSKDPYEENIGEQLRKLN